MCSESELQTTRKVSGVIMVNKEGIPIKTTMDSSTTAVYGGMVIISLIILFTDNSVCLSSEIATKFFLKKGIVFSQPTEYVKKRALTPRDHKYKQNLT